MKLKTVWMERDVGGVPQELSLIYIKKE